jgi:hypothetical protein
MKDVTMRSIRPAVLVLGLTALAATCGTSVHAQDFGIVEVNSTSGLAVDKL